MDQEKATKRMVARVQDYKITFGSENGQKVLWDLMKTNFAIKSSIVPGDSYGSAFNEGRRAVILDILSKINIDPNKYLDLIKKGLDQDERTNNSNY